MSGNPKNCQPKASPPVLLACPLNAFVMVLWKPNNGEISAMPLPRLVMYTSFSIAFYVDANEYLSSLCTLNPPTLGVVCNPIS